MGDFRPSGSASAAEASPPRAKAAPPARHARSGYRAAPRACRRESSAATVTQPSARRRAPSWTGVPAGRNSRRRSRVPSPTSASANSEKPVAGSSRAFFVEDRVRSAAPDLAARAVREQREAEPGLVLEAVALGRVEGEGHAPSDRFAAIDATSPSRREVRTPAGVEGAQAARAPASNGPGGLDQREVWRARARRRRRRPWHRAGRVGWATSSDGKRAGGERVDQIGKREVDRHPGRAGGSERLPPLRSRPRVRRRPNRRPISSHPICRVSRAGASSEARSFSTVPA